MFSIIMPMDIGRVEQFKETKLVYDGFEEVHEFVIPTRSYENVAQYLKSNLLDKNVRLIKYEHKIGFNPSKAFNIGVREAKYDNIIITSPEVKPTTEVLKQLSECLGKCIVCQVHDQDASGNLRVLVNKGYRGTTPAMYFLALFPREGIEAINGWDEDFMLGYAYEDDDFGARWVRAELPFEVREDIQAVHQYHPRPETIPHGTQTNLDKFNYNNSHDITYCENGLKNDKL